MPRARVRAVAALASTVPRARLLGLAFHVSRATIVLEESCNPWRARVELSAQPRRAARRRARRCAKLGRMVVLVGRCLPRVRVHAPALPVRTALQGQQRMLEWRVCRGSTAAAARRSPSRARLVRFVLLLLVR